MEGDALLTFDPKDTESATVNLCADLDIQLDATHRVRAVALWDGNDEGAFDPNAVDRARATLAWVDWFNHRRLLDPLGFGPPAEAENAFYQRLEIDHLAA